MSPKNQKLIDLVRNDIDSIFSRFEEKDLTLTLDSTGVNGHLQLLTLCTIGMERLNKLKRVNLISGSFYAYCAFISISQGYLPNPKKTFKNWDRLNRLEWHNISRLKTLVKLPLVLSNLTSLYDTEALRKMFVGTTSDIFSNLNLGHLPPNVVIWLATYPDNQLAKITCVDNFETTLRDLAGCCAAIPKIYGPGTMNGQKYVDPVFSGKYKELRKRLTDEAGLAHLFSNVIYRKDSGNSIWLKPHSEADGVSMIRSDFLKMLLNLPNSKIYEAYNNAYGNTYK